MADFFLAGSDTTTTTLDWAILYLIRNQDIQAKLRDEIEGVTGKSRLPSLTDKTRYIHIKSF